MKLQLLAAAMASFSFLAPSVLANPVAVAEVQTRDSPAVRTGRFNERHRGALIQFFKAVSEIPDSVLIEGDDATHKWLIDEGYLPETPSATKRWAEPYPEPEALPESGVLVERADAWKVANCVGAITLLLTTNAVPAAKLLRIKQTIQALGGVKSAVQLMLGVTTTAAEKWRTVVELATAITGITAVQQACF